MVRWSMILLGCLIVAACGREATTPAADESMELPAEQVIHGVRHVMTNAGVRTAVLHGDSAYMFEDGRRFDVMGVRVEFFNETGAQSGYLTSETGEYQTDTGLFIARGNVRLIADGPEGQRRLETEQLHYDISGDRIWSDVAFVLMEAGRTTRGTSFRSDARFERWEIQGGRTQGGLPSDLSF